jgi:type VI secretion system protein ImpJ
VAAGVPDVAQERKTLDEAVRMEVIQLREVDGDDLSAGVEWHTSHRGHAGERFVHTVPVHRNRPAVDKRAAGPHNSAGAAPAEIAEQCDAERRVGLRTGGVGLASGGHIELEAVARVFPGHGVLRRQVSFRSATGGGSMRHMQPVVWTKGVLLSPQHLQAQDRYLEELLRFQLSTLTFSPWGFHRLTIDHEALAHGAVALSAATGIFPDGLLFDMPVADALPAPRVLEGCWDQDRTVLDVFLAVPEYREGGYNIAIDQQERTTRYRADVVFRPDENTGLAERPIQVARKNCRLLVEGEVLEGHSVLRVARVRRLPTGSYDLDSQFVPPVIDIAASDHLLAIARGLVELLAAKSTALGGTRRQKNQSLANFGISDIASYWLLYTVNTYLPEVRHHFETRRGHPTELYTTMVALTGALTTFSRTIQVQALPVYEHDDLSRCFTELDAALRELLETVVPVSWLSLPLRPIEPFIYATAVDDARVLTAPQLYLAISTELRRADLAVWLPQQVKVSSRDHLDRLIRHALAGVELRYVPNPPNAVPVKLDYHYFQVNKQGPDWDAIGRARNVAVYVPGDVTGAKLELVAVLGEGGGGRG